MRTSLGFLYLLRPAMNTLGFELGPRPEPTEKTVGPAFRNSGGEICSLRGAKSAYGIFWAGLWCAKRQPGWR